MPRPKKLPTLKVVQNEEAPVAAEILADSIVAISESMQRIDRGRLTRDALVALIKDHTNISKRQINVVLNSLEGLARIYLKKAR
jgi:uncharacterized Ntn-hydrolase superfamily protein